MHLQVCGFSNTLQHIDTHWQITYFATLIEGGLPCEVVLQGPQSALIES